MTIWETRNPVMYSQIAEKLCHFNFTTGKAVADFHPLTTANIQILEVINAWGPDVQAKLDQMRECHKASSADPKVT